jgi:uroporphyrinogen-III synthase
MLSIFLAAPLALVVSSGAAVETSAHSTASLPRPRALIRLDGQSLQQPAFLTREDGKNDKLQKLLDARGVSHAELPCIAAQRLPGFEDLTAALETAAVQHSWVVLTSPEAATIFLDAWGAAKSRVASSCTPQLPKLATVGVGTARVLTDAHVPTAFVPSKATGKVLAAELPAEEGAEVLYPASALASGVVESGLTARGIRTRRIDTYTTVAATWNSSELERARAAAVVTFGSPSAVRVWAERAGTGATAVCIGETSAAECRRVGFERVLAPESPGVEAWADTVAALDLSTREGGSL